MVCYGPVISKESPYVARSALYNQLHIAVGLLMKMDHEPTRAELLEEVDALRAQVEGLQAQLKESKAESQYRQLVENAHEGITVIGDGRVLFINKRALNVLRITSVDASTKRIKEFIHPEDREMVLSNYYSRLRGDVVVDNNYAFRVVEDDGTERWVRVCSERIEWEGQPAVLSFYDDIDEAVRANVQLERSERRLREVIDLVPHMIFARDINGRYLLANKATAAALGTSVDELVGACHQDFCPMHSATKCQFLQLDRKVIITGEPREDVELPFIDAHGESRMMRGMFIPYRVDGIGRCCLAVCIDVTEELESKERLSRLSKTLLALGDDHDKNIQMLVELCGELLGADCALYNRLDGELLRTKSGWKVPPLMTTLDRAAGHICSDVIHGGRREELFVVRNLQKTPYALTDPNVRPFDLQTYMGMPVFASSRAVGSLCAVMSKDYEPNYEDEWFLSLLTSAIASEEDRMRSFKEWRDSEARYRAAFEQLAVGMVQMSPDGRYKKVNDRYCEIVGCPREALIGEHFLGFIHPADKDQNREYHDKLLSGALESYDIEKRYLRRDREMCWARVTASPVRDVNGRIVIINAMVLDITFQKNAEKALRESEEKYRLLFHNASDAILLHTSPASVSRPKLLDCNRKACEIFGYKREEFLVMEPSEIFCSMLADAEGDVTFETEASTRSGQILSVEVGMHSFSLGEQDVALSIVRDITERKRMEQTVLRRDAILEAVSFAAERFLHVHDWRAQIEAVLKRLGEAADVSRAYVFQNVTIDNGNLAMSHKFEWCAEGIQPQLPKNTLRQIEYAPRFSDLVRALGNREIVAGDVRNQPRTHQEVLKPQGIQSFVLVPIFAGGEWWGFLGFDECRTVREWFSTELEALMAAADMLGNAIVRTRAEDALRESDNRFRLIAETVEDIFWISDPGRGRLRYYSPALERRVGSCNSREEAQQRYLEAIHPEDRKTFFAAYADTDGDAWEVEYRLVCQDGTIRWFRERAFGMPASENGEKLVAGLTMDVTEQKRNEEQIRETLRLKSVLLQEIHHRVKNNLQIISSLLDMAGRCICDDDAGDIIRDLQSKIHSMAMIHMQLYGYDNFDSINISDYAQMLAWQLSQMYGVKDFTPVFDMEVINLPIDLAIPCGLVLSEAFSNAFKHAFGESGGRMDVCIRKTEEGRVRIRIADDGPGIPGGVDFATASTLGLKLMRNIVEFQLGGSLDMQTENGTALTIVFGDPNKGDMR